MDPVSTRIPVKRRGWIDGLNLGVKRELNWREQTRYERYCQYCEETIGCKPAKDHIWYVVNQSLPSV